MRRSAAPLPSAGMGRLLAGGGVEEVQRLIDDTVRAYDARYAAAVAIQNLLPTCAPFSAHEDGTMPAAAAAVLAEHVSSASERRAGARARAAWTQP